MDSTSIGLKLGMKKLPLYIVVYIFFFKFPFEKSKKIYSFVFFFKKWRASDKELDFLRIWKLII